MNVTDGTSCEFDIKSVLEPTVCPKHPDWLVRQFNLKKKKKKLSHFKSICFEVKKTKTNHQVNGAILHLN